MGWNGYGVCSNLASSGEPPPLLHKTTLTTGGTPSQWPPEYCYYVYIYNLVQVISLCTCCMCVCMYVRMVCIQQWMMTLAHDAEQSEWLCTAERPSGRSYLFFEEFKLQVAGAQLQQVTAEASSQFHVTLVTLRTS